MSDARQRYEAKGQRPRQFYGVRLSEEEVARAESLMQEGETVQDVLRRLLMQPPKPRVSRSPTRRK